MRAEFKGRLDNLSIRPAATETSNSITNLILRILAPKFVVDIFKNLD